MKQIVRVVVRLNGRSTLAKLDLSRYVVSKMKGNANFPTLTTQVDELEAATEKLEEAITAANSGSHENTGEKQLAEADVMERLAKLCDLVNGQAAGDKAKLLTCGLPMRRENTPIGQLPPPTKLVSRNTTFTGSADLAFNGPRGSRLFNVYMSTTNDPFNWVLVGATTKQRFTMEGLEPRELYWFSVTALGAAGESSKSEPCRVMAAA